MIQRIRGERLYLLDKMYHFKVFKSTSSHDCVHCSSNLKPRYFRHYTTNLAFCCNREAMAIATSGEFSRSSTL